MRFSAVAAAVFGLASFAVAAPLEKRASGTATWYTQNGNAGNCGWVSNDWDYVVALDSSAYDGGSHCGSTNDYSGQTIVAKVADSCPSCGGYGNIDLSEGAFSALSSLDAGVFSVTWWFN